MRPFQPAHLYIQVRNELAKRIARAEYPAGSLLPNEFVLANEMQVSVGTVRKAVAQLGAEKLVNRSQGRGTVVADRQSADFRSKFDRVRHANGAPVVWKFHGLESEVSPATEEEQRVLRLKSSDEVISVRRLRETGGRIVKHEYTRLPLSVFGPIDDLEAHETVIEDLAFMRGVRISNSEERLALAPVSEPIARLLSLPTGVTLLRLERIIFGEANEPIEWRITHCNFGDLQYLAPSPLGQK